MKDTEKRESCFHRFNHRDGDAEIEVVGQKTETIVPIEDSVNPIQPNPVDSGYISLPNRLSFNLFVGWMAHLVVISIGGTSMYTSMKSEQAILNDKVSRIEATMYTIGEANLRLEMQKAEIASLKEELKEKNRNSK